MGGRLRGLPRALLALALVALAAPPQPALAADQAPASDGGLGAAVGGPSGITAHSFYSDALGRTMPYVVYTPPGYGMSTRRYSVLYMLHGLGGSDTQWQSVGLFDVADRLIRARTIAPLIIVLPQGDAGYWMDHAGTDHAAWGTYTARDVVADVDAHYRTLADRAHRAIGGMSMGAHGAVQLALNHPDVFSAAGAHSLVLRRQDQAFPFFGTATDYAARDPYSIVAAAPDVLAQTSLWVDIGDRDPWTARTYQFENELLSLGIAHEWHVWQGDHSGTYWSGHLADYLGFYDRAFRGIEPRGRLALPMESIQP